jgi:flagellar basal-body rod protein FlgG
MDLIRGLYTAASGMITKQLQEENLSNNIANINTPGYKNDKVVLKSFNEMLIESREKTANGNVFRRNLGTIEFGVGIDETKTNFTQGVIEETGRYLDFAIEGNGFFTVKNANGEERYTRDGRFRVDNEGYLVDSQGQKVLFDIDNTGNKQPIIVGNSDLWIDGAGNLNGNGIKTADGTSINGGIKFNISRFEDMGDLVKDAGNSYLSKNQTAQTDNDSKIRQNSLEKSNIDPIEAITEMISIMRSYESSQKVIQQIDETLGKTVNEVGSIK